MKHTTAMRPGRGPAETAAAIQQRIDDAAAAGGGQVVIPAGDHWMDRALRLRCGVRLRGEHGTVLRKTPSVTSRILDYLGYGHYEITVAEPERFRPGMGIHVLDRNAQGFYTTVASITAINGERIFLDRMLNHDYGPGAEALAVSVFPLIEADGVSDAGVENLCLDGNREHEAFELNGCRGGGLFLYRSCRVTVRNLEIREYRGDGISFQQCVDVDIEQSRIHHNTGGGLHPGSGTVRYRMCDNHVSHNGRCGFFYCLRTTHSICRDNLIESNGEAGISIGERDTDHRIDANTIRDNAGPGIVFRVPTRRSGDRVLLEGNTLADNCRQNGLAEIEIHSGLRDIHLCRNRITSDRVPAIHIGDDCSGVYLDDNTFNRQPLAADQVHGARARWTVGRPPEFPPVGPWALPLNGAWHLGIEDPGPCRLPPEPAA